MDMTGFGNELCAEFGAIVRSSGKPVITPLGRWAARHLAADLPSPADPDLSAGEMIAEAARFSDEEQQYHVARGWLVERKHHLHLFQAGKKQYSDPFVNLERTGDEDAVRLRDVLTPGGQIEYTYDLGAEWEHEIAMERIVTRDPDQDYPVCLEPAG